MKTRWDPDLGPVTLMFSIPVMILDFILQRRVVESLTADAVKG